MRKRLGDQGWHRSLLQVIDGFVYETVQPVIRGPDADHGMQIGSPQIQINQRNPFALFGQ